MSQRLTVIVAALLALAVPAPARAGDASALDVGFGRRSLVTEKVGISLGGYGGKGLLPALGVHDAPMVKAMVIRTPERTIAFVTADMIGVQRAILDGLRARPLPPEARLKVDDVIVAASHTHHGYGSLARPTGALALDALFLACCGPFREDFFDETLERFHGALVDACEDLRPAAIGVGSGEVRRLARNRGRGGGPTDPEVGVVKVVDPASGAVRGLLVNLAAHPVIVGAEHFLVSADFPGALQRDLERRFPGATALFTQGAEGDQTVRVADGEHKDDWAKVEATGAHLAGAVERIAAGIEVRSALGVASRRAEVELPRPEGRPLAERIRGLGGARRSLIQQMTLGDALFMGVPGEPCCRIGLDMKEAARARGFGKAFVVGLALDHCGYFVHAEDYAPGLEESHGYEKSLNFSGPAIGGFLVRAHMDLDPRPITTARAPAAGAASGSAPK